MRNREITVIPWTKKEDEILQLHCKIHRSNRMVRFGDNSLRCSFCGGTEVATMIKMTVENKEET